MLQMYEITKVSPEVYVDEFSFIFKVKIAMIKEFTNSN